MLLGKTFRMVYLKCVSCNGKLVKLYFSRKTQKHVLKALTINIAYKIHFFLEKKILVALDTHAKKLNPCKMVNVNSLIIIRIINI